VPLTRLAEGATYAVTVAGLADAVAGAIVVPPTTFTTQSTQPPNANLDALVFSFPNEQGEVILNGPPGTLEVGSTILIVNESTGEVSTLGVNNDGSVSDVGGKFVANIADRLIVTITDPQGRTTSFKRSEYVKEDGTTAVGNGGGEILGPGGAEVRIPEDAVMQGVAAILKIAAISIDQLPEGALPDLPGATAATALKLEADEAAGPPAFNKEVDLVFPKPADAPDGATYLVYRRMAGPNGRVAYESIDYATVEGTGADAKVVTASHPFAGYVSSINGYNAQGVDFGGAVGNQFTNYAILMFLYDLVNPGAPLGGVVTGRVLRAKWAPGAVTPTYEPVKGALVSGQDASGQPLFADGPNGGLPPTLAVSQADGTYSLFDRQYTGGAVTVFALSDSVTRSATAYEVDPQNAKSPGLVFAKNVATANITFPALPPSPVQVEVMTLDANGARKASNGIVIAGGTVVIGVKGGDNLVQRVDVQSGSQTTEYGVKLDPLGKGANGFDVVVDSNQTFATPGSFTITATALNPGGGVVIGNTVVRAVVAGGGNNDPLPNHPPAVLTVRTVPKPNATGVQIGAVPQIAFTEPVQNVPAGVTLTEEGGGTIGVVISGVGPDGPIANLTPQSIVTSITIQPSAGLKYGTKYTLSLSSDIFDTDPEPSAHKPLVAYTTSFTTFVPESIGQTEELFTAGGMAVIGDRAYVATSLNSGRYFTNLRLFDLSDLTSPTEIKGGAPSGSQVFVSPPAFYLGLPVDLVADEESPLTGGPVVAVATTPLAYPYHSSSVRLFDVSNDQQWKWIGAVSLGRDPMDGMIRRIEMKGSMLYAVTAGIGKGIQFVDLNAVQAVFDQVLAAGDQSAAYWQMQGQLLSTEGFAQETIVNTVHVDTGLGANSQLWDLAVTDLTIGGMTQPTVIATGKSPLAIATQTDGLIYNGAITDGLGGPALTGWGYGVAAGAVNGTPIAVVSALGVSPAPGEPAPGHVLAVVDLTNPLAPRKLATLDLPGSATAVQDVLLRDGKVYVGTTSGTFVVAIDDPAHPELVGSMPNVSGRLVLGAGAEEGLLFSAARGILGGETPLGGLRTTALTSEAPRWITRPHYVTDPEMRGQNTSSCAPNCGVGRPVNVVTGNTYFDQTDGVVAGVHGLNFTRSYNSRNAYRGDQSILGRGWTHSFESTITEPEEGALALTGPDGVPLYFRDAAGEGRYEAFVPAGERSVIVKSDIEPRYVRFFMNGSKETFNTAGLLMSREDALGQATSLGRDEQRRLISITDPGGRSLTLRYNDDDRLIELKAGAQVLASYAYDSGNLSEVTYGDASGYRFTYDSQGQVLSVVDHSGRTVEKHTYDAQGRATLSEIENGRERLVLTYDDSRQVTSVADALGNTTQYQWRQVALVKSVTGVVSQCATCDNGISTGKWSYDSAGRVRSQKGASGATTAIVYDPAGNLTSQSEPSGRVTNVTYDERGRPLEIRDSDGSLRTMTHGPAGPLVVTESLSASESRTTSFTYTARGQVSSVTDPRGKTTTFSWSSAGDLESVTSPTQATTTFEYDSLGRRTSTTDPRQRKMTVDYDERGRPTRITAPDQTSTSFGYDLGGRRTTITDQVNRTTSYVYDPYGRLTQVVAPVGTTTYGYDLMANLVEQTEANGQTTQFAYDANRRLSQTTYPGGASERYSYDAAGRLSSRIDRRGVVTTYTYDSAGRLKGKAYSDGSPAVAYSYDAAGYMRSASNGTDSLTWTHDLAGRLLSEQSVKNSSLVEYGYDAADNRISVQLNGGALLGYTYDDASRLTSLSRGPAQFGFTYDPASQRSSLSYPNGIVTNYTLDESSRLLEIAAGTVTRSAYGYDALGNRTSKTTAGYTETYGYDPLGRLTGVDRTGSSSRRFAYDAVGNRTSEELDGAVTTTATYDQLNQLRTRSGASTANYSYDPNGSLDTKVEAGATWRYEWNVEGQLARVTKDGNEVARFTYDPLGRRVEKIAGAVTHSYAYDGMDVLRETVTNGATSTTYRFIHAPGVDQPLAKEDVATGALTYFHADGLGSIVATTDQAGVVTSSITYDAWGNIETGTPAPYAFTGREWDAETGLYYYRARYYDPAIGRFISEDPIGLAAGPNFYAYVSNQPTMLRDPFGLDPWWQNALNSDLGQALVNPWSANVAAGVGDNLSFGATTALNNLIGNGAYIDECSDAFGVGQNIGRVISAGMWVAGPFKAIGGMTMRSAMYNARNFLSSPTAGARQFANSFWRGTSTGAAGRELHHWAVPVAWFKNMPAGARAVFQGGWNQIALSAGTNGWLRPGSLQDWIVRATLAGGLAGIAGGATEGCGCKN
jgi:RHS repeat-associated protein